MKARVSLASGLSGHSHVPPVWSVNPPEIGHRGGKSTETARERRRASLSVYMRDGCLRPSVST